MQYILHIFKSSLLLQWKIKFRVLRSLDRLTWCSSVLLTFPAGKSDLAAICDTMYFGRNLHCAQQHDTEVVHILQKCRTKDQSQAVRETEENIP